MNEDQATFRLGIIGGCMSHQDGMPLSKLYHRQLGKLLLDETGVKLRVQIVREFQRPYHERLDALVDEGRVDGVLLHMRVTAARKSSILSRHSADGIARYYVHPFLFNRRSVGWAQVELNNFAGKFWVVQRKSGSKGAQEHQQPVPGVHVGGFRANDLNIILGHLIGLDNWAIRDEIAQLADFAHTCQARGVPFIVLGPSPHLRLSQVAHMTDKMNRRIKAFLDPLGVPFCAMNTPYDDEGKDMLMPDGQHLTENGHRYVARQLLPVLAPWAQQILKSSVLAAPPQSG